MTANIGYISRWFNPRDIHDLLEDVKPGDRLQIHREHYHHWVVFYGYQNTFDDQPFVVHRTNQGSGVSGLSSGSNSGSNGMRIGHGNIFLELLDNVVHNESKIRINNSLDTDWNPLPLETIRERLLDAVRGKEMNGAYNVMTNNCEHFASWARNDQEFSLQVGKAVITGAFSMAFCTVM